MARARRRPGRVDSRPVHRHAHLTGRRGGAVPIGGRRGPDRVLRRPVRRVLPARPLGPAPGSARDLAGRGGRHPAARRGRRALGVHAAPGRRRHGLGRRRDDRVPRRGHRPHGARDLRRRVAWGPSRRRLVADRRRRDADRARRRGVHAGIGRRHGAGHDDRTARDPLQHGRGLPRRGGAAAHAATAAADARRLARAGGPHRSVRRRAGPARARHGGHAHTRRDGSADRRDRAHRRPRRHRVSREHRPGRQPPPGVDRRAHRPPQPPQCLRRTRRSVRGAAP